MRSILSLNYLNCVFILAPKCYKTTSARRVTNTDAIKAAVQNSPDAAGWVTVTKRTERAIIALICQFSLVA